VRKHVGRATTSIYTHDTVQNTTKHTQMKIPVDWYWLLPRWGPYVHRLRIGVSNDGEGS
jgi:hypothetical protein